MIYLDNGEYKLEKDEPLRRSCWLCNPAHDFLKTVDRVHKCIMCGRLWIYETFLDDLKTVEQWDAFVKGYNIKTKKKKNKNYY